MFVLQASGSRHEPLAVLNGLHALIHREFVEISNPFVSRITREIEGELAMTEGFH